MGTAALDGELPFPFLQPCGWPIDQASDFLEVDPDGIAVQITGLIRLPIPSRSIRTVSPLFKNTGGSRNTPTPDGVPVEIKSPGSSVMAALAYSIRYG